MRQNFFKKNFLQNVFYLAIIFSCLFFININAYAQTVPAAAQPPAPTAKPAVLPNPLAKLGTDPAVIIGQLIKIVLGLVGSITLLMFVYGGLLWMTSAGKPEKVEKGKQIIIWTTLGLALIFSSYMLVNFLFTVLARK